MDEVSVQSQTTAMDKAGSVALDIESLMQQLDKCCSGSPKMTKALSRKGSSRMERRAVEDHETNDASKKIVVKVVPSQLELLKQPLVPNKAPVASPSAANSPVLTDSVEGRNKRFNRLTTIHPRKILLFFATIVILPAGKDPSGLTNFRLPDPQRFDLDIIYQANLNFLSCWTKLSKEGKREKSWETFFCYMWDCIYVSS